MVERKWRRIAASLALMVVWTSLLPMMGCKKKDDFYVYDEGGSSRSRRGDPDVMFGRVVDRNDKPLAGVAIRVSPGTVDRISNKWGEYDVENLFSDDGERLPLKKNQDYTISAWKAGFHETTQIFRYEGGSAEIPTITLVEDSITLSPENILDPATLSQEPPVDSQGQSYEN